MRNLIIIALATVIVACYLPAQAGLTLANPDWSIILSDHGYADVLLDKTPGREGREYLSGEWPHR